MSAFIFSIAFYFLSCIVLFCCTVHYCLFSFLIFSFLATSSINWIWIWSNVVVCNSLFSHACMYCVVSTTVPTRAEVHAWHCSWSLSAVLLYSSPRPLSASRKQFVISLYSGDCNCNCNWGTCIAPPSRRPRAHRWVNPYLGVRRENEIEMFSDHYETSPSIAAVSALSLTCSMLVVQQQKRLCHQFVDVFVARWGCHTLTNK